MRLVINHFMIPRWWKSIKIMLKWPNKCRSIYQSTKKNAFTSMGTIWFAGLVLLSHTSNFNGNYSWQRHCSCWRLVHAIAFLVLSIKSQPMVEICASLACAVLGETSSTSRCAQLTTLYHYYNWHLYVREWQRHQSVPCFWEIRQRISRADPERFASTGSV